MAFGQVSSLRMAFGQVSIRDVAFGLRFDFYEWPSGKFRLRMAFGHVSIRDVAFGLRFDEWLALTIFYHLQSRPHWRFQLR
jgi:hypothetical protein